MKIFCFTNQVSVVFPAGVTPIFDLASVRLSPQNSGLLNSHKENVVNDISFSNLKKAHPSFGFVVSRVEEIQACATFADFIYVPGEYCRQSDILEAASATEKTILLERGAFLTPKDLLLAQQKISKSDVWFVDAGSSFGYNDRVLDVRALDIYKNDSNRPFGIHIGELISPSLPKMQWAQQWSHDIRFAGSLIQAAKVLGISFVCCRADSLEVCLRN